MRECVPCVFYGHRICAALMICFYCAGSAMGMHISGHVNVVNLQVNKENRSVLPEGLFDVFLGECSRYDVVYKEKAIITVEEQRKIETHLGGGSSPVFRYVDSGDRLSGVMPFDIRQLFDRIDAFCMTNGTDYFAASINSTIIDNGEYCRALFFVITNTPPSSVRLEDMHPVLKKLRPFVYQEQIPVKADAIPIGVNPVLWFCGECNKEQRR